VKPEVITVPLTIDQLKKLIQDRLDYGDCAKFVAQLINKAAELSEGKNPAVSTDIMTLFEKIKTQPKGGFRFEPARHPIVGIASGTAVGHYSFGNVTVTITPSHYSSDNPKGLAYVLLRYGIVGLHEVIHRASNAGYDEDDLLKAVRALDPKFKGDDWDDALREHCLPPNQR
jgi:hypothetical protein